MTFISKYQLIIVSVLASSMLVVISLAYSLGQKNATAEQTAVKASRLDFEEIIAPDKGVELPVIWGDFGKRMVETGVIDKKKFESIYSGRGGLSEDDKKLLYGDSNGKLTINRDNAGFILNLLWGLGLGNKNEILEKGPMVNYDGEAGSPAEALAKAGRFASTGGWSIAVGNPMDHYSHHNFINLTKEQQKKVEDVSKNIYRPCCGNSTYFPDCNHGMAMLGLLELMASQGVSEQDMYKYALVVNSYWFPDTYVTIARYFKMRGVNWSEVDQKEVLGNDFSSAYGIQRVAAEVGPEESAGGGSCGV